MEVCIVMLLASLTSAQRFVVNRLDKGDVFAWYDAAGRADTACGEFSNHTAWPPADNAGHCQCDFKLTFSTEDNKCRSYREQGKSGANVI